MKPSDFLKAGYAVFECNSNREPKVIKWDELEYWHIDAAEADTWKCYAIQIPENVLVIDVDLRKEEAHESFERLTAFVDFSNCFTCRTARNGYHYWFFNPILHRLYKKRKDYLGIDFLSKGSYVIGPGSVADTGVYPETTTGSLQNLPEAPEQLLKLLQKNDLAKGTASEFNNVVETSIEMERYRQWVLNQPSAIQGENGDDHTYALAAYSVDFGIAIEQAFEVLKEWNRTCQPPWEPEELLQKIKHAHFYAQNKSGSAAINFKTFADDNSVSRSELSEDELEYDKRHPGVGLTYMGDHVKPTISNLRICLLHPDYENLFQFDVIAQKVVLAYVPPWRADKRDISLDMQTSDWIELRSHLALEQRIEISNEMLSEGVMSLAYYQKLNPITDWLSSLKWDGTPRFSYLFGDSFYTKTIAKIFLLASIYRAFHPGYKFDHMLVLAGRQGIGKSYLVSVLGGAYAKVLQHMPTDRKGLQELQRAWWVELPELSALKKADIDQIKAFITTTVDTYIPMYGRNGPQDIPRMCIPVWTMNPKLEGFMLDSENRRFLIVEQYDPIPITYIKEHRNQIFAEAMELYRAGKTPHEFVLDVKEEAEALAAKNKQDDSDPWYEPLAKWIEMQDEGEEITTLQAFKVLGAYREIDYDRRSQMRIASIFKQLGLEKKHTRTGNIYICNKSIDNNSVEWDI